ncbi:MAG: hypothetical protein HFH48_08255 [Lachnospiraceae bacterium]|nr:hypothetical protein [Lachnospiraceae bacterium]
MNKVDLLLKRDDNTESGSSEYASLENSRKFIYNKRSINAVCKALCLEGNLYKPEITVKNIKDYLESKEKIDRVLYSEISNYIFSLDMSKRSTFASNVEMLLLYVLDENNSVSPECREMTIRIYDHFQLALHQIENANNIFAQSIEEAKNNLNQEVKGIEKEYISILGIFAAIVLAFVGGITFSSSVLQNINEGSIFRLLLIVDILAAVLLNVIYMLIKFILLINTGGRSEKTQGLRICYINIFCSAGAVIIIIGWLLNVQNIPEYLRNFLLWG